MILFLIFLEKLGINKNPEIEYNLDAIYFTVKIINLIVTGYFVIKFYIRKWCSIKKFIIVILEIHFFENHNKKPLLHL